MDEQLPDTKDVIKEFCRSQGAPTADWLGRLSTDGQRECIRQWILRVMGPEIRSLLPAVAEELHAKDRDPRRADDWYEECVRRGEFPPEAVYPEGRMEYREGVIKANRHYVDRKLLEELRYGAIEFDEIDLPKPSVTDKRYLKRHRKYLKHRNLKYRKLRNLCDQEWQRMVEGKQAAKDNLHRVLLPTLLVVATALISGGLYVAMWCAVIGGMVTTFLIWPRRGRNLITETGFDGFARSISKKY